MDEESPPRITPFAAVGNLRIGKPDSPGLTAITPPAHTTTNGIVGDIPPEVMNAQVGACHSEIPTDAVWRDTHVAIEEAHLTSGDIAQIAHTQPGTTNPGTTP